jgi:hypothetical protein
MHEEHVLHDVQPIVATCRMDRLLQRRFDAVTCTQMLSGGADSITTPPGPIFDGLWRSASGHDRTHVAPGLIDPFAAGRGRRGAGGG